MSRNVTPEEVEALRVLRQGGRILAILIPEGVPQEAVQALAVQVNAALDRMVVERGVSDVLSASDYENEGLGGT